MARLSWPRRENGISSEGVVISPAPTYRPRSNGETSTYNPDFLGNLYAVVDVLEGQLGRLFLGIALVGVVNSHFRNVSICGVERKGYREGILGVVVLRSLGIMF